MSEIFRRTALISAGAASVAAAVPVSASASAPMGPNDRRLIELSRRYFALAKLKERERSRLGETRESEDRTDQIILMQDRLLQRMARIPADSMAGVKARALVAHEEVQIMWYTRAGEFMWGGPTEEVTGAFVRDFHRFAGEV